MADFESDRVVVGVEADATGFGKELQAKIDKQVRNVRARVQAQVDARQLQREVKAAAAKTKPVNVTVEAKVNQRQMDAAVKAAVSRVTERNRTVSLKADLDTRALNTSLAAAVAQAKARVAANPITIPVRAAAAPAAPRGPTGGGSTRVARPASTVNERDVKVAQALKNALDKVGSAALKAFKFVGLLAVKASLLAAAAPIAAAVAAGLFSIASAAGQAAGLIATIPAAIAGAALSIGTLTAAFAGVGEASKALTKQTAAGAADTAAIDKAKQEGQRRIQDAVRATQDAQANADDSAAQSARRVVDARRAVADAVVASTARVASAEQANTRAQANALRAQEALNNARKAAKERLEDMALSLKSAALDEEAAGLQVERARIALDDANRSATSTDLDRREADLAYRQAVQGLENVKEANADLRDEAKETNAKGVEGSDQVVSAQQDLIDAQAEAKQSERDLRDERIQAARDVSDAERDLADARKEQAKDAIDSTRAIADAQRDLQDARDDAAEALAKESTATSAAAAALADLSPAAVKFAKFLSGPVRDSLLKVRKAAQSALLPPLQTAIEQLLPLTGLVVDGVSKMGTAFGDLALGLSDLMSTSAFKGQLKTIIDGSVTSFKAFSPGIIAVVGALTTLAAAAQPVMLKIADAFSNVAQRFGEFIAIQDAIGKADPSKGLAGFFQRAFDTAGKLIAIIGNIGGALFNLGKAASPAGQGMLDSIVAATQKFQDFTALVSTQNKLRDYFDQAKVVLGNVIGLVGDLGLGIAGLFPDGGQSNELITKLRDELLPVLVRIFDKLNDSGITDALVGLLVKIAEAFERLLDSGAGGGIASFITTLGGLVEVLGRLVAIPGVGEALGFVATGLAAIAAVKFAGQVTGISAIIDAFKPGTVNEAAGAVRSFAEGLGLLEGPAEGIAGGAASKIKGIFEGITGSAGDAEAGTESFAGSIISQVTGPIDALKSSYADAKEAIVGQYNEVKDAVQGVKDDFNSAKDAVKKFKDEGLDKAKEAANKAKAAFQSGAARAKAFATTMLRNVATAARTAATSIASAAAATGRYVAAAAKTAAIRAFTAAQAALNVVMALNPFVLILIGIAALVAAFILAYKKSETFRNIVNAAFEGVKVVVSAVLNFLKAFIVGVFDFVKAYFTFVFNVYKTIITTAITVIKNVVVGTFNAIKAAVVFIFNAIKTYFVTVFNIYKTIISTAVNAIKATMSAVFGAIKSVVLGIFNGLKSGIETALNGAKRVVDTVLGAIKGAFEGVVKGIKSVWDGLKEIFAAPIRFVINTVYNNGLKKAWNFLADKLPVIPSLPDLTFAGGGVVPGRATPGRDTANALLSPGEGILVPQAVGLLGGEAGINRLNEAAMKGSRTADQVSNPPRKERFGGGGVFGKIGGGLKSVGGALTPDFVGEAAGAVLNQGKRAVMAMINKFIKLNEWLSNLGGSGVGRVASEFVKMSAGKVKDYAISKIPDIAGAIGRGLIPGIARGATVLPQPGGTLAMLAEAGKAETVVDEGKMNGLLDRILSGNIGGAGVTIEEGAIQLTIVRPPDEPTERSLNDGLRKVAAFGVFGNA